MAISLLGSNAAAGIFRKSKVELDDSMMDNVAGGCGRCESLNSYKRFIIAAAIVTGYGADFRSLDLLIRAYLAAFEPNTAAGCTDTDSYGAGAAVYRTYSHI